jgi:hypothetical protein
MSGNKLFMELKRKIRSLETRMKFVRKVYLISGRKNKGGLPARPTGLPYLALCTSDKEGSHL